MFWFQRYTVMCKIQCHVEILSIYVGALASISDLGRRTSRKQVLFAKKAKKILEKHTASCCSFL